MSIKIQFELKIREAGQRTKWENMPVEEKYIGNWQGAARYALELARQEDVEEVRYNEKGSLQGHYVRAWSGPTALEARLEKMIVEFEEYVREAVTKIPERLSEDYWKDYARTRVLTLYELQTGDIFEAMKKRDKFLVEMGFCFFALNGELQWYR